MFDLDRVMAEWRRQMAAAGIKSSDVLDELEGHLRDEMENQVRSGLTAQQAFEVAVRRIGQPGALKTEFSKVIGTRWALLRKLKSIFARSANVPFPSLDDFSASAKQTLELARAEAPRLHHNFIGTEHVLLGLLTLENGVVLEMLRRIGVDRKDVQTEIEKIVGLGPDQGPVPEIPFTPRARKALRLAADEARALNHPQTGPEHIFLGLIEEGSGVAALVLRNLGVNVEKARDEIRRIAAAGT